MWYPPASKPQLTASAKLGTDGQYSLMHPHPVALPLPRPRPLQGDGRAVGPISELEANTKT